jgi:hypothetical protein
VGVFHRTGIGRLIDRTRLEQLVQLRDLLGVLLGRRPVRSITERPSSMRRWRAWSACCSSNKAPASCSTSRRLLRRRFGGQPAQHLGDEPLVLGLP